MISRFMSTTTTTAFLLCAMCSVGWYRFGLPFGRCWTPIWRRFYSSFIFCTMSKLYYPLTLLWICLQNSLFLVDVFIWQRLVVTWFAYGQRMYRNFRKWQKTSISIFFHIIVPLLSLIIIIINAPRLNKSNQQKSYEMVITIINTNWQKNINLPWIIFISVIDYTFSNHSIKCCCLMLWLLLCYCFFSHILLLLLLLFWFCVRIKYAFNCDCSISKVIRRVTNKYTTQQ